MKLRVAPLTPDRWPDLEEIFNARGCSVARGCWYMAYRLSGSREPLPPGMTRSGAVAYAKKRDARLVEAYPVDKPGRSKAEYMWFGAKSMYDKAGFKEVARRKPQRPIVRIKPA